MGAVKDIREATKDAKTLSKEATETLDLARLLITISIGSVIIMTSLGLFAFFVYLEKDNGIKPQ